MQKSVCCPMETQRCCKLCGETFEIERKVGRPRLYCFVCSPAGWQVVKVPHQTRYKLRRRPPAFRRIDVAAFLSDPSLWDGWRHESEAS